MATAVNPSTSFSISIGSAVGAVADWLRQITVRITGSRGSRGSGVLWNAEGLVVTNAHVAIEPEMRAGELVIAIGNPWDGESAVSTGVVHHPPSGSPIVVADIRLAPGNSGGPLADAEGNLIGINSMVVGGLGCAVSSDAVQEFVRKVQTQETF